MSLRNGSIQVEGMEYAVPKHLAIQIKDLVAPFSGDAKEVLSMEPVSTGVVPADQAIAGIIIEKLDKEGIETTRKALTKHLKTL